MQVSSYSRTVFENSCSVSGVPMGQIWEPKSPKFFPGSSIYPAADYLSCNKRSNPILVFLLAMQETGPQFIS
jgi:hypothetical protein